MKKLIFVLFLSVCGGLAAQENDFVLHTPTGDIFGTISVPEIAEKSPLVLLIAGSGPTDRNGNNPMMTNNSLKMLADSLAAHKVATLCFDKRGIAASAAAMTREDDLRFETYINDVKSFINTLSADGRFSDIVVAGHSEGALIGLVACQSNPKTAKYISIAGTAVAADEILKEQLAAQPQTVKDMVFPMLDSLKAGKMLNNVPPMLYSFFRPSVQPYMISWLKYNPQEEIKKLAIPILIVQGTTDIQVPENHADLLHAANPNATFCKIENMNHVLKTCAATEQAAQTPTYTSPDFPLAKGLVECVVGFVK
ncbi:alpha/beta hydrolase [Bacteroidia bacterium]|nr:alpha/beta hydrolase [Bacteroidia bacterium]